MSVTMSNPTYEIQRLCDYVGFRPQDHHVLTGIEATFEKHLDQIIDAFYRKILDNPMARDVLIRADSTVDILKIKLGAWLRTLITEPLDLASWDQQRVVGHRHVQVNLPHSFMVLGMSVLKSQLGLMVQDFCGDDISRGRVLVEHIHLKCDVLMAIMLDSYHEDKEHQHRKRVLLENAGIISMGRMSATIAHEIKNPLAGIHGAVSVLHGRSTDPETTRIMGSVLDQVDRLARTVTDLLEFARPITSSFRSLTLKDILESLSVLKNDPDFHLEIALDNPLDAEQVIQADPLQMKNVFMNLFLNANDAGARSATLSLDWDGDDILLHVRDDGPGISSEMRENLFNPFTTDKAHGTGLGLALCQKIIRAHGGRIDHVPTPQGCTFSIRLPRIPGPSA